MTKKSLARQQRDEVAKNAQQAGVRSLYAVLEDMYQQQRGLFGQYSTMIRLISNPEVTPHLRNPQRTDSLLKGMAADIDDLLGKTEQIYDLHKGKAGWPDPKDEDVHYNLMQMQQQYIVYLNVHQQNILPVMFELDEMLNFALRSKQATQANAVGAATAMNNMVHTAQAAAQAAPAPAVDISLAPGNPYEAPAV